MRVLAHMSTTYQKKMRDAMAPCVECGSGAWPNLSDGVTYLETAMTAALAIVTRVCEVTTLRTRSVSH